MEAVGIFTALMGVFLVSTHGNPTSLVISPAALFWSILSAIAIDPLHGGASAYP